MRVALVGPAHPYKGGGAQHTTELAHRLHEAGHNVTIESWRSQYPRLLYPGVLTISEPEVPLYSPTLRDLRWSRPDSWLRVGRRLGRSADTAILAVLSTFQVPSYLVISHTARRNGVRLVALCHNVLPHEETPLNRRLMTAMLNAVDGVLVHSPGQARLAASLSSTRVWEASMPPHFPELQPEPVHRQEVTTISSPVGRRLLFFGVVRPYKGVDVLLRALAHSPGDVHLTIAGEIWHGREDLIRLISELGLAGRVSLREGYVPASEVPRLFAEADALVLPYRSGTASQNALIAFEFGVPVIATTAANSQGVVRPGVNGVLCPPDDVDALGAAISTFYQDDTAVRLRNGVRAVGRDALWSPYIQTVVDCVSVDRAGSRK